MKKLLALLIALAMLWAVVPSLAEDGASEEPVSVTIFHTNDTHGRYDSAEGMGFAMMASFVNAERANGANVLVLDAGDTLHGTVFANIGEGENIVEVMNSIGYSAMTPGNHDFNYGYDRLKELEETMDFPLLNANILLEDGSHAFTPYTILEIAGKKIAIVGAANPTIQSSIHPDYIQGLVFEGIEPVAEAVQAVRDEADAVIILCHWGCDAAYDPNSVEALASIEGVSLVIDGHSHTALYDIVQHSREEDAQSDPPLVTSAGEYLQWLGKVVLTFAEEGLYVQASLIPDPGLYEDHDIINLLETLESEQSEEMDQVVGSTSVELIGEREIVRRSESNWGNLVCDILLDATDADVAITNGGSIRATIPAGDITARDVNTVFPFGNLVVLMEVSGQDLLDSLEGGLSVYPETNGGFPQVGGMTVRFDPAAEPGERIVEVLVGGEPLDPEATYKLATNDYLATGQDGYTPLGEAEVLFTMGAMDEVIINYLKENSPVAPEVEGRMVAIDAQAEAEAEPEETEAETEAEETTEPTAEDESEEAEDDAA
ncbi:MAG TPA: bifunctional metallophosphatase/5'-nucleotidase [Candidatus Avichristensenella intestinipullorum]|uniref:Bifunctional metallophosphatase/5'-nucleotidase n=1 Tax=Candidatus Avichristensenella intestinipullorum TaxID=2840693 RepID=A0A9D0YUF8_9FIRM|nr:bifunctional metallophosphatase/5'-nucleotidase [Candidatus Avichristensenella intestinipullorum]